MRSIFDQAVKVAVTQGKKSKNDAVVEKKVVTKKSYPVQKKTQEDQEEPVGERQDPSFQVSSGQSKMRSDYADQIRNPRQNITSQMSWDKPERWDRSNSPQRRIQIQRQAPSEPIKIQNKPIKKISIKRQPELMEEQASRDIRVLQISRPQNQRKSITVRYDEGDEQDNGQSERKLQVVRKSFRI